MIEATTTVITNTRADHLEDIGESSEASAQALAWSICANGQLVVSAEAASPALLARAKARGTAVTIVDTAGLDPDRRRPRARACGRNRARRAGRDREASDGCGRA